MALSAHVAATHRDSSKLGHMTRYVEMNKEIPKYELPKHSLTATAAAQLIRDELRLDGNPALNLASFVSTQMDQECHTLMTENLNKNMPDQDQYPHSNDIQDRCVNILASLFHAPDAEQARNTASNKDSKDKVKKDQSPSPATENHAVGTATIGSSEAILLAGLAMKWQWRSRIAASSNPPVKAHEVIQRPNLIFSAAVHVSVLKLCRYFDIDARIIPLEHDRLVLGIDKCIQQCDVNTCGVVAVLGTTLTGECDDIPALNTALQKLHKDKGWFIPIHVDGASGAFVIPFVWPNYQWDFRLEHVRSINTSGHKYGLVYPGLGWVIWRTKEDLPADLVFHVNYLGVDEPTYTLNFSKSAGTVIAQYYNFIRLGRAGYEEIMNLCHNNAQYLASRISVLNNGQLFVLLSKQQTKQPCLPLVAFRLKDSKSLGFDEPALVHEMRVRGWIIPAYTLPANAADITICRIVVRETFTREMANMLTHDLILVLISLCHQHQHAAIAEQLHEELTQHHERYGPAHRRNRHATQRVQHAIEDKTEQTIQHGVLSAQKLTSDADTAKVKEMTGTDSGAKSTDGQIAAGNASKTTDGAGPSATSNAGQQLTTNVIC